MGDREKRVGALLRFSIAIVLILFFHPQPCFSQNSKSISRSASGTQKFIINRIEVIGNTLLPSKDFEPLIAPAERRYVDLQTLINIANQITLLYFKKGYLLARAFVPPQRIENGVARIYVMEGRVGTISVEGNHYYPTSLIRAYILHSIKNGYFRYDEFQRSLLLLNELPDLQVKAVFRPGKDPGTSDLTLNVKDKNPVHEGLDYNNFGNRFVGVNRAGFEVWDSNFSKAGDLADVRGVFPFPSQQNPYLQFEYNRPISDSGGRFGFTYANADIKAGQELQPLDIRGTAAIYAFTFTQPIQRTLTESSDIGGTFTSKNVNNFIFGSTLTSYDKVRELTGSYDHHWIAKNTQDLVEVSGTQGLGTLFGGMPTNYSLASRPGADDQFTRFNADAVRILKFENGHFIIFRGEGQLSFAALPITEQYSLGGPDSVRGYQQAELLGDSGWLLSAEYRIPFTVKYSPNPVQATFNLGTGDAFLQNPQAGEFRDRHLTGFGVGLRTNLEENTSARIELGFPLDPSSNSMNDTPVLYTQFATQF